MNIDQLVAMTNDLSTTHLEMLITRLAEKRAHMQPPVRFQPPQPGEESADISIQIAPALQPGRLRSGGMRLWLRSSGLGWMVFDLTALQTITLRDWINRSGIDAQPGPNLFSQKHGDGNNTH